MNTTILRLVKAPCVKVITNTARCRTAFGGRLFLEMVLAEASALKSLRSRRMAKIFGRSGSLNGCNKLT
jgi:hypothetical protein